MLDKLVMVSALVSLCSACGGGGGAGDGGEESKAIDACQLVTQADATALFGQPAVQDTGAVVVDPALLGECLWTWEAADYSNHLLAIYVWNNENGYYYSAVEGAEPLEIGEEGYITVDDFTGVDIGWAQEEKAIYLDYFTIGPSVPVAATKVEEVKAIAWDVEAAL